MLPSFISFAADAASSTDPTLTVIASAFGGAALTGLITLVVNWQMGIRERKKWVLEARYGAYMEYLERIARDERELLKRASEAATNGSGRHGGDLEKDYLGAQLLAKPELVLIMRDREHKYAAFVSAMATAAVEALASAGAERTSGDMTLHVPVEDYEKLLQELSVSTAEVITAMRRELGTTGDQFWDRRKRSRKLFQEFWEYDAKLKAEAETPVSERR